MTLLRFCPSPINIIIIIKMIITRYTMVHGQCLTVGVGGFILGGGENEQLIKKLKLKLTFTMKNK